MLSFKEYLIEAAKEGKNLHLEHLEDEILNFGVDLGRGGIEILQTLRDMFKGGQGSKLNVTVKWDGAPAIVCGKNPENGKFFVGSKSVFNKTPKINYSIGDIRKNHKGGVADKLAVALKHLKTLPIKGILQGDMMFGPGDVKTKSIDGVSHYTFTPNTITYAVEVGSELANQISRAKIGIVFHTEYTGATLPEMTANFGYSVRGLQPTADVWYDDANYKDVSGIATLTPSEEKAIDGTIATGRTTLKKVGPKMDQVLQAEFAKFIKPFINNNVRAGEQVGEPTKFLQDFMNYYNDKMNKEVEKLKGGAESPAAQKRFEKIEQQKKFLADNSNTLLLTLAVYRRIISAKLLLISKLSNVDKIGTFVKTENGYRVTNHEGFVAFGIDGGAVKLNDRMEFNALNFSATKTWSK